MPQERQVCPDEADLIVRTLAMTLPDGSRLDAHSHPWAQLIYAASGVMTVHTPVGAWVVPSRRAVWAPAGDTHEIETTGAVALRTLYLRPDFVGPRAPASCRVINVSPLLRELVLRIVAQRMLTRSNARHRRLADLVLDELAETHDPALELPMPRDPRARRVAERVCARPGERTTLAELCTGSGASARTIERRFRDELGLTFGKWRRRARLLHALRRLAAGATVAEAADHSGYDSPSAFIAMCRRTLGATPRQCLESRNAGERIRTSTSLSDTGS